MKISISSLFLVCLLNCACALNPSVYVVTPSSRTFDEGRSAPFYYHNWMRRQDTAQNLTTTSTTTTPKVKTPDLIFAEFESGDDNDMKKTIRKLLERERIMKKATSTTSSPTYQPIYVPDEESKDVNKAEPSSLATNVQISEPQNSERDMTDYFALYNNLYNNVNSVPDPDYLPKTTKTTIAETTTSTTTTTPAPARVENIWHIIDSEKQDKYSGNWEEVSLDSNDNRTDKHEVKHNNSEYEVPQTDNGLAMNFALPGFHTNPGNGAENESRAIRTEPNIRFPYVSLKPFQMKNFNKPLSNSKTSNKNMYNLDDFRDIKNPVRGEAQDVVPMKQTVDRYNPAQPYLPQEYGSKSKQSGSTPSKAVANLVPPPPPPPPKATGNDFPSPTSYESFPPYAPLSPDLDSGLSPPVSFPGTLYQPQNIQPIDDSASDSLSSQDDTPMDLGYRNKPPRFLPTLPPKPFGGYPKIKPSSNDDFVGMNGGFSYNKPSMTIDVPPVMDMGGYTYNKPQEDLPPMPDEKPDFHGYHYKKPLHAEDDKPHSYNHPGIPSFNHNGDYPDFIFDKPHGGGSDVKEGNDMNDNDVVMMPPPPPADMKPDSEPPMDDHGFPADFPGDFKFSSDFGHDDFYHHHHHHHPTTTTSTTEMPRVNRYSYYYLGKKLYYLPLYFSVYFIVYVGALIIKAVLRHKIVYPNSWRPNDTTATFFAKRSVDSINSSLTNENLHEMTGRVTKAIAEAAEKYINKR